MLRAERKGKNGTCHRPERRMDRASSGIGFLRVALGEVESPVLMFEIVLDSLHRTIRDR